MGKLKIMLDVREENVMVGVGKDGCDPVLTPVPGGLDEALAAVPELVVSAEAKWGVAPRNPLVPQPKPKPQPKKAEPKAEAKPAAVAAGPVAQDLPLLAEEEEEATSERPRPADSEQAAEATQRVIDLPPSGVPTAEAEPAEVAREEAAPVAEARCRVCGCTETTPCMTDKGPCSWVEPDLCSACAEVNRTIAGPAKEVAEEAAEPAEQAAAEVAEEPEVKRGTLWAERAPEPVAEVAEAEQAGRPGTSPNLAGDWPGGYEAPEGKYYLTKDGRGPFATIQEALDALGIDKEKRPMHNRYSRLSKDLQQAIEMR